MLFFFSSRAVIWIPDRLKENFKILPSHQGCILAECSTVLQLILPSGLFCYKRMARLRILKCIFILKVKKKFSISSVCVTESGSLQWILDTCVSLWILSHQSWLDRSIPYWPCWGNTECGLSVISGLFFFNKRKRVNNNIRFSVFSVQAFERWMIVAYLTKPNTILGLIVLSCRDWTREQQRLLRGGFWAKKRGLGY